ncbi:hypothetical protein [Pseudomonas oryzihabitans]|uniref:hypothetical protein n=1 Tax=Pseudomonas oryzihabitans TaxID=47885 RepID=UPI00289525CB|nr:hypothetical protein [Pseudomonas oryzihabitans]MDT3723209.1 hypothetical protein [Pseudomonas oryzihabitans]
MSQLRDQELEVQTDDIPGIVEADNVAAGPHLDRGITPAGHSRAPTVANTRKKIDDISSDVVAVFGRYDKLIGADRER